jgi:hypothetical protein
MSKQASVRSRAATNNNTSAAASSASAPSSAPILPLLPRFHTQHVSQLNENNSLTFMLKACYLFLSQFGYAQTAKGHIISQRDCTYRWFDCNIQFPTPLAFFLFFCS